MSICAGPDARIRGRNLIAHARERALSRPARVRLLAAVCRAEHHAHTHGVIHRDLKPANILVDEQAQPKIFDFGVARMIGHESFTRKTDRRDMFTAAEPEQAPGERLTVRDVLDVAGRKIAADPVLPPALRAPWRDRQSGGRVLAPPPMRDDPARMTQCAILLRAILLRVPACPVSRPTVSRSRSSPSAIRRTLRSS